MEKENDFVLIQNKYFFEYNDCNGNNERTKQRLIQIEKMGLVEVGEAQFGVPGIMSGLYIEKVWSYNNENWNDYIDFTNDLINKSKTKSINN